MMVDRERVRKLDERDVLVEVVGQRKIEDKKDKGMWGEQGICSCGKKL